MNDLVLLSIWLLCVYRAVDWRPISIKRSVHEGVDGGDCELRVEFLKKEKWAVKQKVQRDFVPFCFFLRLFFLCLV